MNTYLINQDKRLFETLGTKMRSVVRWKILQKLTIVNMQSKKPMLDVSQYVFYEVFRLKCQ